MPGSSSMPSCSRFQKASRLAIAVSANGRVNLNAPLSCRASQCATPRSRATASRLVPAGDGLDQGERHRHRRGDPGRRRNAPVDHEPPVRDIADRGMLLAQLVDEVPVRRRPLAVEQSGCGDDLGAGADADDDRALGRLALEPFEDRRIVVAAHGGDDHVVCAVRMTRIELRHRRLRLDLERRIQRHRPRLRRQRHHIGDVGTPQDAVRHQIVGGLGGVVDADDRDQRALALRRLQAPRSWRRPHPSRSALRTIAAGVGGSESIQPPPIITASATTPSPPHPARRRFMSFEAST